MHIAHLDADCFYVSAERVRNRFLNGKPVGVLGNQGACVIAKSYEMKAAGVKTGEPIWDAVQKCPEALFIKRDFHWYEVLSRMMLDVVREVSPTVEYYSIDEFFFATDASDLQRFAEVARDEVTKRVGVPVTIGVARTRTLAKLVSDLAKPFGALALVDRQAEEEFLATKPVSDVTGIGGRRAIMLTTHGIKTCLDLARARPSLVRSLLTVVGEKLCYELRGEPAIPIQTLRPPHKLLSRGGSIGKPSTDPAIQWAWAIRNLERLIEAMEFHGLRTEKLTLILEYKDGLVRTAEARTSEATNRYDQLLECVNYLWPRVAVPGHALYRMHYIAGDLTYPGPRQLGLFGTPPKPDIAVRELKRSIGEKHGRFALRSAATLPLIEIYEDEAHSYDICDVHGKTCF
ncbi:MAG: nucleotidyltransferase [Pirellulales bacterium]